MVTGGFMKHARVAIPILTMLAAVIVVPTVTAQSVDDLVAKNLKARGGAARLKAIDAVKFTGRLDAGGMELPFTLIRKRPNLVRQEMQFQGKTIVQAYDGEHAWAVNPMMGTDQPQEIRGQQAEMMREQVDFDGPLVDYKQKGNVIEVVGPDAVGSAKAMKLKITKKSGQVQWLWLDAESGIELKSATEEIAPGDQKLTIETVLSDYKAVDGIQFPFTMETIVNGAPQSKMTVDQVDLSPTIDSAMFKMPAK
jgi:outer membrane lipoprotein-sorting protein